MLWQLWAHGTLRNVVLCVPALKPRESTEEVSPSPARTRARRGKRYLGCPTPSARTFHFHSHFLPRILRCTAFTKGLEFGVHHSLAQAFPPFWFLIILPILRVPLVLLKIHTNCKGASQVVQVLKNTPAIGGDIRDIGSIPGLRRSPGGGHGSPLQYSCLENPHDRGGLQAGYGS